MDSIKDIFKDLCSKISNKPDKLFEELEHSGFFEAPASIRYHYSFDGGLSRHALNVLNVLRALNVTFNCNYAETSLIKVAIFHEFSKATLYEKYLKNEKRDNQWVQVSAYRVIENRDTVGDIGLDSYFKASKLVQKTEMIPFTDSEVAAICNYSHILNSKEYIDINTIMQKHQLTALLHIASIGAMYILENQ